MHGDNMSADVIAPEYMGSMGGLLKGMQAMRALPKGTHFCLSREGYPCSLP